MATGHTPLATLRTSRAIAATAAIAAMLSTPFTAIASSWSPTLLVNTEAFQEIDEGDGSSDIYLQFGTSAAQRIIFSESENLFIFSDDVKVYGNISASGSLSINADNAGDALITFNNGTADQTITYSDSGQRFFLSKDTTVDGNLSGATLTVSDLKNCEVIVSDVNGNLSCSTLAALDILTEADGDARYINASGDTMTGALRISNGAGLTASGNIVTNSNITLNSDNGAADALLTFGNDAGAETLRFSDTSNAFEFSDDVKVRGNLSGSSLTVDSGTVSINGVDYTFTNTDGSNGYVLSTDGAGNLTWQPISVDGGSGAQLSMHPEYPNAIYAGTGAATVGQLKTATDSATGPNYYRWSTSRAAVQRYDIVVRVKVPDNFSGWDVQDGVQLQYRTTAGATTNNSATLKVYDTAGAIDHSSGELASTSFATTSATAANLGGTYTPGSYMTVRITAKANSANNADIGFLNFNWRTTTP